MSQLALLIRDGINSSLSAAGLPINTIANGFYAANGNPLYPSNALNTQFIGYVTSLLPAGTPPSVVQQIQQTVGFYLPFYTGVKNGYFNPAANVSRT
jgi:hypothetical protein